MVVHNYSDVGLVIQKQLSQVGTAATRWTGYYPSACVEEKSSKIFTGLILNKSKNVKLELLQFKPQDALTKQQKQSNTLLKDYFSLQVQV